MKSYHLSWNWNASQFNVGSWVCAYGLYYVLFADDTTLVADAEEKLCQLVEEFGRVCKSKLRVNENKSKVMKYICGIGGRRINIA